MSKPFIDSLYDDQASKNMDDILKEFSDMLAYFQVYPDKFIDYILPPDSKFELYPFQRVYLRILARYRKVYLTATRGTSKSFLNILSMYLKCMFFPNIKLSVVAPQKDQASAITMQNLEAIWNFIPLLKNEINFKDSVFARDYTKIKFWNNSVLDVVVAGQGSRGLRKHGLSFEEIVQMEKHREIIGEVLLPLLANNRKGVDGKVSDHEIHKQIIYITTAASRQSYAWEQLYSVMIDMALGKSAYVMGNDYALPVMFDQLDASFIEDVKNDPAMSPLQFAREYGSVWTGSSENSLVQLKDLESSRVLTDSEYKSTKTSKSKHEYIISVDVSRSENKKSASTAIGVIKITERGNGTFVKHLVHLHTYNKDKKHFEDQSLYIKELVDIYNASMLVIDANGLGKGLVDYLIKEDKFPSYSVTNDDSYDKYKQPNSLPLIYNISSNTKGNKASDIHNHFMGIISNHELKLLVSEMTVKESIKEKDADRKAQLLQPYIETDRFIDEVMNLVYVGEGNNTSVKQVSKAMDKDRYSAVSYGLWYIYQLERSKQRKRREVVGDPNAFMAVRKPNFKVWG